MPTAPFKYTNLWPALNRASFWLAVLIRVGEEYLLYRPSGDALMQTATTFNMLRGHGISMTYLNWSDLGSLRYEKLAAWPPGFAWVLAVFLPNHATDGNILAAQAAVYLLGLLLLFGSWWYMLRLLQPTLYPWAPAVFFLYWGISSTPFHLLHHTDLPALACCTGGVACLLQQLATTSSPRRSLLVAMAILSFAACLFRFAYYPLAFLPPLVLLLRWWRQPVERHAALGALVLTGGLVGALVVYQKFVAGNAFYLTEFYHDPAWHLHFSNLRQFVPFPIGALLGVYQAPSLAGISLSCIVLGTVGLGVWHEDRATGLGHHRRLLFAVWSLVGAATVAVLIALSLRYPPAMVTWFTGGRWTYVADPRYFGPAMLILTALLLLMVLSRRTPARLRGMAAGLLALAAVNALVLRAKDAAFLLRHPGPAAAFFADKYERNTVDVRRAVNAIVQAQRRGAVLLTTDTYAIRLRDAVTMRGGLAIPLDTLLRTPVRTTRPVTIFMALGPGPITGTTADFLRRHKAPPAMQLPTLHLQLIPIYFSGPNE